MAMSKMSHLLFKQNSQQPKQFRGGEKKVMKKSLSLLLAIALVVSMFASAVSAADEKSTGEKLKETGIITGDTNGSLQEKAEWPRKDLAVILARLSGAEAEAKTFTGAHGFTDLDSKFYNPIVAWAKSEGLVTGKTETTFAPNDSVTNLEFAALTLRVLGLDKDVAYADSLTKAIELKLFPADTDAKAAALRGDLYDVIEAALNTEVDGKKLGTKLNLKGYEITELKVESASAVVGKTITVNFNDAVTSLNNTDVTVADKDGNNVPVQSVKVEGKVATITLTKALAQKEHTVTIAKASSKESSVANATATFTYTKGVPASIEIKNKTVAQSVTGSTRYLEYIVKDANGVDITGDFGTDVLEKKSSNESLIKGSNLEIGTATGMVVVNLSYSENSEVTTGNQTINVVAATSITVSKTELIKSGSNVSTLYLDDATAKMQLTVKDQNGTTVSENTAGTGYKVTYTSSNPAVVAVTNSINVSGYAQSAHGTVTGLQAGTATITASVEHGSAVATTTYVVTVKEAKKLASFTVDKTAVNVVYNAYNVPQTVTVTLYDQYGDVFKGSVNGTIKNTTTDGGNYVAISAANAGTVSGSGVNYTFSTTSGKVAFNVAGNLALGTATVQVKAGDLNAKNVTVNAVAQASASTGYDVVYSTLKLDSLRNTVDTSKAGDESATVNVYQLDSNGNRVQLITDNVTVELGKTGTDKIATVTGRTIDVVDSQDENNLVTGTDTVTVKVKDVTVSIQTLEVVTTSTLVTTKVTQDKASVKVAKNATFKLVGTSSENAFTAYNQYGDSIGTAVVEEVVSSNSSVVAVSGAKFNKTLTAGANAGTAVLTVKINGAFYTVTVVVE